MKIKVEYLSKIQRECIKIFENDDEDHPDGRRTSAAIKSIIHWLNKITDNEYEQTIIWDIVDKYKFDKDWNATYKALEAAGYEVEKNDI